MALGRKKLHVEKSKVISSEHPLDTFQSLNNLSKSANPSLMVGISSLIAWRGFFIVHSFPPDTFASNVRCESDKLEINSISQSPQTFCPPANLLYLFVNAISHMLTIRRRFLSAYRKVDYLIVLFFLLFPSFLPVEDLAYMLLNNKLCLNNFVTSN